MKKIKKARKNKVKVKTKKLVLTKKVGRPKKAKKLGRPCKVKTAIKETKRDKMQKIAKLGKRKYKKAIEEMAAEKVNKKVRRKGNGTSHDNGNSGIEKVIGSRTYSYESQSRICAGPNIKPVGIDPTPKKKTVKEDKNNDISFLDKIKSRLRERGYKWKESTFKIVEKNPNSWIVEFVDKNHGEITSLTSTEQHKQEQKIEKEITTTTKTSKLSKVELNQYVKKLINRGYAPKNIKVLENTKDYFKIEFNDGDSPSLTTLSHVKSWEL